jgi:hypothetical protein
LVQLKLHAVHDSRQEGLCRVASNWVAGFVVLPVSRSDSFWIDRFQIGLLLFSKKQIIDVEAG